MSESTPHLPDDLDAGWDESKPANEPLHAAISSPAISEIDAGWDLAPAPPTTSGNSATEVATSGKRGLRTSKTNVGPTSPKKKQLRLLERQARAHQFQRDSENRAKRKASLNTQRSGQRDSVPDHHPPAVTRRQSAEEHSTTMSNPQPKGSKRKAKAGKSNERRARATAPESGSQANVSSPAAPTNRAMRRAGTAPASASRSTTSDAMPRRPSKRPAIGPFTLFIGVVLVASIFSYLFIR